MEYFIPLRDHSKPLETEGKPLLWQHCRENGRKCKKTSCLGSVRFEVPIFHYISSTLWFNLHQVFKGLKTKQRVDEVLKQLSLV